HRGAQDRAARVCRVRRLRPGAAADQPPAAPGAQRDPDAAYRLRHRRELPQLVPADRRERHRLPRQQAGSGDLRDLGTALSDGTAAIIRPSRDDDVAAITAIYGHYVLHGVASFEEVPPALDEMARRRDEIVARGLPYLVAER